MNLPFLSSFFGKKEKKEYFLALLLRDEKVTAVIFEELTGKVRVVGKHEELLKTPLEDAALDEWLDIFDKTISQAESTLSENVETQKTIFGVKESWVEDSKIKKEYLIRLKKVSDTLGLLPIGFLVIHEAIAHLLQKEEGAPVSGILVEIGQKNLTVSLLRAGRVIETKQTTAGDNVAQIIDQLLHHFTNYEVLPSRMLILSDTENKEKLSQIFISHTWSKSLPFLHVPQISILPKNFDAKAVLSGAASQMGFEFITPETKGQKVEQQQQQQQQQQEEEEESFGFVKGIDVNKKMEKDHADIKITQHNTPEETNQEELLPVEEHIETLVAKHATTSSSPRTSFLAGFITLFSMLKGIAKKFSSLLPKKLFSRDMGKKKVFFPAFGTIIIVIGIVFYIIMLKATITLSITPKIIEQKQDISFSTKNPTDTQKNIIATDSVTVEEKGKVAKAATGKKEVGAPAKGTVTIFSRLTSSKTIPAGTTIQGQNLSFTLDKTVTIDAIASSSADQNLEPIKTNAAITASDIGKEYNLPSNVRFTVDDFKAVDLIAKNDTAFSGGAKKEVTVVSKKDIDSAATDITNNLAEKAKQDMAQKIDGQNKLLPITTDTSFTQDNLDKKINEEASTFTLSGTVTFNSLSYKETDMQQLIKNLLSQNADPTFTQANTTYEVQNVKQEKNTITATVDAKAFLLPKLNNEKIIQSITGKSFTEVKSILLRMPQVSDVHITLTPNIPLLPAILPRMSRNITLHTEQQ